MSDRYQIIKKIGQGGIGAVYEAFDIQLKRRVALKRVLTPEEANPEAVAAAADSLLQEATTMSTLNHPNIVTVYDVGRDEQGGFVVMELLNGETVDQTIAKSLLTLEDFREVVNQTLEGLIAAQAADMMHRDLKPGNIMVIWRPSGKFQIKILDFGLAKVSASPSKQTIDQGDAILGSIFFMAPEQFERAPLTFSADLYAMGAIYYFTLTGKYPFNGPSAPAVMAAHLRHDVTPLQEIRPDLPAEICQWVMWLINRNPADRPQTAREALDRFPPAQITGPISEAVPVAQVAEAPGTPVPGRKLLVVPPAGTPIPSAASPPVARSSAARVPASGPTTTTGPRTGPSRATGSQTTSVSRRTGSQPVSAAAAARLEAERKAARSGRLIFWGTTGTSALILTIFGLIHLQNEMKVARYRDRIEQLDVLAPKGTTEDVALLTRFLSNDPKEFDPRVLGILSSLEGPGIDEALIAQLKRADSGAIRTGLLQAIANRSNPAAFDPVLDVYRSASGRERTVAAETLRRIARPGHEARLIVLLADAGQERTSLENAVIHLMRQDPDVSGRSETLLNALNQSSGEYRRSLARILGALGGERALSRLSRIISERSSDPAYVADVVLALGNWPDRTAGPLLRKLVESPQTAVSTAASRAYIRLLSLPGPDADDPESWHFVLEKAPRADAMRLFGTLIDQPTGAAVSFLKEPAPAGWEPAFQQALPKAEAAAKNAYPVISGQPIPVNRGRLRGESDNSAYFDEGGYMIWVSPRSWISWTLLISEPGTYRVEVMASSDVPGGSQFSVNLAGQRLEGESVGTGDKQKFSPATINPPGTIRIGPDQTGVHILSLHGGAVTQEKIMNVQSVKLTLEP